MPTCAAVGKPPAIFESAKWPQWRRSPMKNFVLTVAFGLVVAFTTPAFAGDTEADCQKAGGTWDAKTKTCTNKY